MRYNKFNTFCQADYSYIWILSFRHNLNYSSEYTKRAWNVFKYKLKQDVYNR